MIDHRGLHFADRLGADADGGQRQLGVKAKLREALDPGTQECAEGAKREAVARHAGDAHLSHRAEPLRVKACLAGLWRAVLVVARLVEDDAQEGISFAQRENLWSGGGAPYGGGRRTGDLLSARLGLEPRPRPDLPLHPQCGGGGVRVCDELRVSSTRLRSAA